MFQEKSVSDLFDCSFCRKSQNEVEKVIAGPKANICSDCTVGFLNLREKTEALEAQSANCSFCGKAEQSVGAYSALEQVQICSGCLDICQEIIGSD